MTVRLWRIVGGDPPPLETAHENQCKQISEISHVFCFDFIQTQQISKRKRKKKQESLQSAPYHLKDGDVIGVKVN